MRIVAGSAGHVWPFRSMSDCSVRREISVCRCEEVSHRLGLVHTAVSQYSSGGMTGNAVFGVRTVDQILEERRDVDERGGIAD